MTSSPPPPELSLLDRAADGLLVLDAEARTTYVNGSATRMLDLPESVLGVPISSLEEHLGTGLVEACRATAYDGVEREVARTRPGQAVTVRVASAADGLVVQVHAVSDAETSAGSRLLRRALLAQDQVRSAFQVNPVPLAILRGRGEDDLEVGRCNDALSHVIGVDPALVPGRSLSEVLGPHYAPPLVPRLRRVLDGTERAEELEVELPRPGRTPLSVVLSTSAFDDIDQTRHLLVVVDDVTRRRSAETAMQELSRQRERLLVELTRVEQGESDRIAAQIHDEPVQWLAAAQLRLGLLGTRLDQELPGARPMVSVLEDILRQASRRLRLLLVDLEPVGAATTREETAHTFQEALGATVEYLFDGTETEVEVHGEVPGSLDQQVAVTLHRVLREALSNARRHAGATRVTVRIEEVGRDRRIVVEDDGAGIVGAPTSRPGHRGLRDMRTRVEALGGTMSIEQRLPHGTRVSVWVPLLGATPWS